MSDRIDFKEIDDEIVEVKTTTDDEKDEDGYEKICFLCHRSESTAGKMIDLPNNIFEYLEILLHLEYLTP